MKPPSWIGTRLQTFPNAVGEERSLPMQMNRLSNLFWQQSVLFCRYILKILSGSPWSMMIHWFSSYVYVLVNSLNVPWMNKSRSLSDPKSVRRTMAFYQADSSSAHAWIAMSAKLNNLAAFLIELNF